MKQLQVVPYGNKQRSETSCWKKGCESLCCIFLDKVKQKVKKKKIQVKEAYFSFSVIFVLEKINCVRASILLAYILGPTGTAKTVMELSFSGTTQHNIMRKSTTWKK